MMAVGMVMAVAVAVAVATLTTATTTALSVYLAVCSGAWLSRGLLMVMDWCASTVLRCCN
jgi:hypothetical protein